jgi:uncharacterized membrane protein HdeD (DUF308 family)
MPYAGFDFVSGAITMGFVIVGLFFFRYWIRTKDGLLCSFAGAFWLLAINQGLLSFAESPQEEQGWIYLVRLAAFGLIIAAIIHKNIRTNRLP